MIKQGQRCGTDGEDAYVSSVPWPFERQSAVGLHRALHRYRDRTSLGPTTLLRQTPEPLPQRHPDSAERGLGRPDEFENQLVQQAAEV